MSVRGAAVIAFVLGFGLGGLAETPSYLWGEVDVPEGAVAGLATRAEELGLACAVWTEEGLRFVGAGDEAELRASGAYLYLDGPAFLVAVETPTERAVLRGRGSSAELIVWTGTDVISPPGASFFDLLRALGLLGEGWMVTLTVKTVPLKLPRVPEGVRLDPVLWALAGHPDWFGAARDYGLERVGLRVRVVAEASGALAEGLEPYVLSSTETLMDLLIPIPLLVDLARDPAVRYVRPPLTPYPAGR